MAWNENLNLAQKTLVADSPTEIDRLCEEFRQKHIVKATQCRDQVYPWGEGVKTTYIRILFYIVEEKNDDSPNTDNPVSTPKKAKPQKELWKNCNQCGARFKYSHFPRCKCGSDYLTDEEQKLKEE